MNLKLPLQFFGGLVSFLILVGCTTPTPAPATTAIPKKASTPTLLPTNTSIPTKASSPTTTSFSSNSSQRSKWNVSIISVRKTNEKLPIAFVPNAQAEFIIITANIINTTGADNYFHCISERNAQHSAAYVDLYSNDNQFAILVACKKSGEITYLEPLVEKPNRKIEDIIEMVAPNQPAGEVYEFVFAGLKNTIFQFFSIDDVVVSIK